MSCSKLLKQGPGGAFDNCSQKGTQARGLWLGGSRWVFGRQMGVWAVAVDHGKLRWSFLLGLYVQRKARMSDIERKRGLLEGAELTVCFKSKARHNVRPHSRTFVRGRIGCRTRNTGVRGWTSRRSWWGSRDWKKRNPGGSEQLYSHWQPFVHEFLSFARIGLACASRRVTFSDWSEWQWPFSSQDGRVEAKSWSGVQAQKVQGDGNHRITAHWKSQQQQG